MGHLTGLAGSFPLPSRKASDVAHWFQAHADILGLMAGAKLSLGNKEPFYEFDPIVIRRAREAAEAPPSKEPVSHFDSEVDRHVGTIYSFAVVHEGYPFAGMKLSGIVSNDQPILRGVYNGFSPAIGGFKEVVVSPEAWGVAEQHIGTPLTRLASVLTWFDVSWALNRVPSTKELHWRLDGLDATGNLLYVFVRSADHRVVYATPNTTSFGFEVHQTHMNDASDVLWDSTNLPNGCTPGTPGCVEPALSESKKSRDILPRTVDLWYRLSSPAPPPFVWPFSGQHKAPLDNRGSQIWAVVAHNGSHCSLPCRVKLQNTYYFPQDPETFPPDTVAADYFGHEYGHMILEELKVVHSETVPGQISPSATFTEAMCDFIGIVTEDVINSELYGTGPDFQIGRTRWTSDGRLIDYAPVSWPLREGDCNGKGRERIGRAFYNSWKWVE
jgi:hypothetical protein